MKKISFLIVVIFFSVNSILGQLSTKNVNITDFNSLKLNMSANVVIEQSFDYKVVIEAEEKVLDKININVVDETLVISSNKNIKTNKPLTIYVSCPVINELEVNGSGEISQKGQWEFSNLLLSVVGSGDINLVDITVATSLISNIEGSGDIVVGGKLDIDKLECSIYGSGDININSFGNCIMQKISVHGSGDIKTNIISKVADVNIYGSGDARLLCNICLNGNVYGSGDIVFSGNPNVNFNKYGSGDIYKN